MHLGKWLGLPSSSQEPRLRRPLRLVMDGVYPFLVADLPLRFRTSPTQVKAATVVGRPRVGIASRTACLISCGDAPACSALRTCEWTAPSERAAIDIPSLISSRVLPSSGPEVWQASPRRS